MYGFSLPICIFFLTIVPFRRYLWLELASRAKHAPFPQNGLVLLLKKRARNETLWNLGINPTWTPAPATLPLTVSSLKLDHPMSRHNSYGKSSKTGKKRNVLKRFERVDVLRKLGKWVDGQNKQVTGLPKTPSAWRSTFIIAKRPSPSPHLLYEKW